MQISIVLIVLDNYKFAWHDLLICLASPLRIQMNFSYPRCILTNDFVLILFQMFVITVLAVFRKHIYAVY